MVANESSRSTITAASLATSVPDRPIATPMSACLRAGRVVDAVSGHGDDATQRAGRPSTIRSLSAGATRANSSSCPLGDPRQPCGQRLVVDLLEISSGQHLRARAGHDADLACHRLRGQAIVARHHDDGDPGRAGVGDRFGDLRPRRILEPGKPQENQVALHRVSGQRGVRSDLGGGHREHAQPIPGEAVHGRLRTCALIRGQLADAGRPREPVAAGQDLGGRTLRVHPARPILVDHYRHPLALRVEWHLEQPRRRSQLAVDVRSRPWRPGSAAPPPWDRPTSSSPRRPRAQVVRCCSADRPPAAAALGPRARPARVRRRATRSPLRRVSDPRNGVRPDR